MDIILIDRLELIRLFQAKFHLSLRLAVEITDFIYELCGCSIEPLPEDDTDGKFDGELDG